MIKLGIIGGNRGLLIQKLLPYLNNSVRIIAIADLSSSVLAKWKTLDDTLSLYSDYHDLLNLLECDAIYIATPISEHFKQSIEALYAGKHVLCAVPACTDLAECCGLIEAVEKTKQIYMLAENYCFIHENRAILKLSLDHVFGQFTYIRGAYIHDCKDLMFDGNQITWRGEMNRVGDGNVYPTHTIGPIAQWLGINKEKGDRFTKISSFSNQQRALTDYAKKRYGSHHKFAEPDFFNRGDTNVTLIETKNGVLVELIYDTHSNRPPAKSEFLIQGTHGCFLSGRYAGEQSLIWRKDDSVSNFRPFDDIQKMDLEESNPDLLMFKSFVDAIELDLNPAIDVYDAATWSSIIPLSKKSALNNHTRLDFPNFKT